VHRANCGDVVSWSGYVDDFAADEFDAERAWELSWWEVFGSFL
jgi:hypothetical protein